MFATEKAFLPEGVWTDFFTGEEYCGKRSFTVSRTLDTMPVFVKEGGIIPLNDDRLQNGCALPVRLRFRIYKGDGSYCLYENDGDKEAFTIVTTKMCDRGQDVTIDIVGDTSVIPCDRVIALEFVNVDGAAATYCFERPVEAIKKIKKDLTLTFSSGQIKDGAKVSVRYPKSDRLKDLKKYCLDILVTVPGDNEVKRKIYADLVSCETIEKLSECVDLCPDLTKQIKNRMKETF